MNKKILDAVENTVLHLPKHMESLLGQRPSGSQWVEERCPNLPHDLVALFERAVEVVGDTPDCTYFRAKYPTPIGTIGYTTSGSLAPTDMVAVSEGAHGLELQLVGVLIPQPTHEAHLILGIEEGHEVVFTAYPGPMTNRIPKDFWEGREVGDIVPHNEIDPNWAIKTTA